MDTRAPTAPGSRAVMATLLVVGFAAALRSLAIGVDGLWLDEVFGASFAGLDAIDTVVAVLRFDIHPPFYYLQLGMWAAASRDDAWLLGNSVAWSLGALCLAALGVYRLSRPALAPAFVAAIVVAVLGSEVHYASELRMYAMISSLTLLGWIRADIWSTRPTSGNAACLVLAIGAVSGTHSSSFLPVSAVLLHAFASHLTSRQSVAIGQMAGISAASAAMLAPWLVNASFRSVSHTALPTLEGALTTFSGWMLGYGDAALPVAVRHAAGVAVVSAVACLLLLGRSRTRLIVLSFVIWPSLALMLVSVLVRPIWIERAVAFSAPFLAVAIALFWHERRSGDGNRSSSRIRAICAFAACIASMSALAWWQATTPRKMQYREAAAYLARNNSDELPIWVPENATFWGMARYVHGPDWGSPLEIQDPVRPDRSETWARIHARLGPAWLERLRLKPSTRRLDTDGGAMWIGLSPLPGDVRQRGFWVVGNNGLAESDACHGSAALDIRKFRGVVVFRCASSSS